MQTLSLPIGQLVPNTGQIEDLPANPRFIRDERFKKLVKSIRDDPEMLQLRECIVIPFQGQFVVIAGNMRLRAMQELGFTEVPCKVLPADTSADKLRAITIKDNVAFGQDDMDLLANEWNMPELTDWGMDLNGWDAPVKDFSDKNKEVDIDSLEEMMDLKFKVSKDDYFDFQERLNSVCARQQVNTKEEALRELLNFYEQHQQA